MISFETLLSRRGHEAQRTDLTRVTQGDSAQGPGCRNQSQREKLSLESPSSPEGDPLGAGFGRQALRPWPSRIVA